MSFVAISGAGRSSVKYNWIGEHISISPSVESGFDVLTSHGGNTAQIFTRSPQAFSSSKLSLEDAVKIGEIAKTRGIRVFIHAPYVVNFAKASSPQDRGMIVSELVLATHMGAGGVVIHMGKSTSASSVEAAHENMIGAIIDVIGKAQEALGGSRTKLARNMAPLLLENPAGQGTEMYTKFEDFVGLWRGLPVATKRHVGICIDTCHIFAAGYDIRNPVVRDEIRGLLRGVPVHLLHINDSRGKVDSHVDRHAELGDGEIGRDAIIEFVRIFEEDTPMVLETKATSSPDDKHLSFRKREIEFLKSRLQ